MRLPDALGDSLNGSGDEWCLCQRQAATVGRKGRSDDKRRFPKSPGMSLIAADNRCVGSGVSVLLGRPPQISSILDGFPLGHPLGRVVVTMGVCLKGDSRHVIPVL